MRAASDYERVVWRAKVVLGIGWGAVFVGILSRLPCQFTDQPTNTCNVHDRCGGVALARPMVLYADPSEPLEGGTQAFAAEERLHRAL